MYRWVDHTGELELSLEAPTPEGVFAEAVRAVGELLDGAASGDPVVRTVGCRARDRAALLAAWIDELVFLAEAEGLVPQRLLQIDLDESALDASVTSHRGTPRHVIKGATYHRLDFACDGGWRARVVLDV